MGLLDVVHTSFGRLMGREHVNCAAGPHQVLVYVKVIRRRLKKFASKWLFGRGFGAAEFGDSFLKRRVNPLAHPSLLPTPYRAANLCCLAAPINGAGMLHSAYAAHC